MYILSVCVPFNSKCSLTITDLLVMYISSKIHDIVFVCLFVCLCMCIKVSENILWIVSDLMESSAEQLATSNRQSKTNQR